MNAMLGESRSIAVYADFRRDEAFSLSVDLLFEPGITVLFGPSGSGKSTILSLIAGLLAPRGASVQYGGTPWTDPERGILVRPEQRRLAYVFQSLALFPHMTALENVAFGIERTIPLADRVERATRELARFSADHLRARKPRTFSGGEAQRVALARAFAMRPRAVLLDEPFSALDADLRVGFARDLRRAASDLGAAVVFVTHDREEAKRLADRVVMLRSGRVRSVGAPSEVLTGSPEEGSEEGRHVANG